MRRSQPFYQTGMVEVVRSWFDAPCVVQVTGDIDTAPTSAAGVAAYVAEQLSRSKSEGDASGGRARDLSRRGAVRRRCTRSSALLSSAPYEASRARGARKPTRAAAGGAS